MEPVLIDRFRSGSGTHNLERAAIEIHSALANHHIAGRP
jgi:hypothetical protein